MVETPKVQHTIIDDIGPPESRIAAASKGVAMNAAGTAAVTGAIKGGTAVVKSAKTAVFGVGAKVATDATQELAEGFAKSAAKEGSQAVFAWAPFGVGTCIGIGVDATAFAFQMASIKTYAEKAGYECGPITIITTPELRAEALRYVAEFGANTAINLINIVPFGFTADLIFGTAVRSLFIANDIASPPIGMLCNELDAAAASGGEIKMSRVAQTIAKQMEFLPDTPENKQFKKQFEQMLNSQNEAAAAAVLDITQKGIDSGNFGGTIREAVESGAFRSAVLNGVAQNQLNNPNSTEALALGNAPEKKGMSTGTKVAIGAAVVGTTVAVLHNKGALPEKMSQFITKGVEKIKDTKMAQKASEWIGKAKATETGAKVMEAAEKNKEAAGAVVGEVKTKATEVAGKMQDKAKEKFPQATEKVTNVAKEAKNRVVNAKDAVMGKGVKANTSYNAKTGATTATVGANKVNVSGATNISNNVVQQAEKAAGNMAHNVQVANVSNAAPVPSQATIAGVQDLTKETGRLM